MARSERKVTPLKELDKIGTVLSKVCVLFDYVVMWCVMCQGDWPRTISRIVLDYDKRGLACLCGWELQKPGMAL